MTARTSGWIMDSWTCHVCKRERPDARISVHSTKRIVNGVEMQQNVRYCSDNPVCVEAAQHISFLPKESR